MYWELELGNVFFRKLIHVTKFVIVKLFLAQFVHLRKLSDLVLFILDNGHHCSELSNVTLLHLSRQVCDQILDRVFTQVLFECLSVKVVHASFEAHRLFDQLLPVFVGQTLHLCLRGWLFVTHRLFIGYRSAQSRSCNLNACKWSGRCLRLA